MKLKMNYIDKWKNSNGKIFPLVNEKTWYNFSVLHYYIALGNGVIEIVYRIFFFWSNSFQFANVVFGLFSEKPIEWNEWNERFVRSISDIYIFSTQAFITLPLSPLQIYASQLLPNNSPLLLSRDPSPILTFQGEFRATKWEIDFHCCKSVSPPFFLQTILFKFDSPSRCDY